MKKKIQYILLLFCVGITACQKELNFQDNPVNPPGTNGGTATYSFAGGTGNCSNAVIGGTYNKGTILNNEDTTVIKIQVDSVGTYSIATANINGISFSSSGTFTATGLQSITLRASGTPVEAGNFTFTPGAAGCTFIISFTAKGTNSGTALYTLNGAPDSCTTAVISGSYLQGIALNASDTVVIKANVSTPGSYTISSNAVNGILFSATGNFTTAGQHTITLKGSGIPTEAGSFIFTPGANGCTFKIVTLPVPVTDCKECTYVPMCTGSKYEYSDTIITPNFPDTTSTINVQTRLSDYLSSADTILEGKIYKKIGVFDGNSINYTYVNCTNGETGEIAYNTQSASSSNVILELRSIELKANAPVGTSWSDTALLANDNTLYRQHTILEKGISRTLLGVTYDNVIRVKVDQSILFTNPPAGLTPSGVTEYYFAKDIGLIEVIGYTDNPFTNQTYVAYHSVLKTYSIP